MNDATSVNKAQEVYEVLDEIEKYAKEVMDNIAYLRKRAGYSKRGGVRLRKAMLNFCTKRVALARKLIEAEKKL